jgi:hypothetical protein
VNLSLLPSPLARLRTIWEIVGYEIRGGQSQPSQKSIMETPQTETAFVIQSSDCRFTFSIEEVGGFM